MKPGRELDAFISEKVIGIPVTRDKQGFWPPPIRGQNFATQEIPEYSFNIKYALEIVPKLASRNIYCDISMMRNGSYEYWVQFKDQLGQTIGQAYSTSLAEGLCNAAYEAVEGK